MKRHFTITASLLHPWWEKYYDKYSPEEGAMKALSTASVPQEWLDKIYQDLSDTLDEYPANILIAKPEYQDVLFDNGELDALILTESGETLDFDYNYVYADDIEQLIDYYNPTPEFDYIDASENGNIENAEDVPRRENGIDVRKQEVHGERKKTEASEYTEEGYKYLLSNGWGPGTIPDDITPIDHWEEGWKDVVILPRELTQEELDYYDIRPYNE